MKPSPEQAFAFAIMLQAGLPASDAIRYFSDSTDTAELSRVLAEWRSDREVAKAQLKLMGKAWQDMSLDERIKTGLNQHYSALAYVLFSMHYAEVSSHDKQKLDSARAALEAKVAGTSGKVDALSRFYEDVSSGRLNLPKLQAH